MRCGYCGGRGHNRTKCPKMKSEYDTAIAIPEDEREWMHRRRIGIYEAQQERKAVRAARAKHRTCTYCKESGHNRTSCPSRKETISLYRRAQNIAVNRRIANTIRTGLWTGALIKRDSHVFVLKADGIPHVQPILIDILQKDSDWQTLGQGQQDEVVDMYYRSRRYIQLEKHILKQHTSFTNMRLLGGRAPVLDWNERRIRLSDIRGEDRKVYEVQALKPSEVRGLLLKKLVCPPNAPKPEKLKVWHCRMPNSSTKVDWDTFEGYASNTDVYRSKEERNDYDIKKLRQYVDALAHSWENKYISKIN